MISDIKRDINRHDISGRAVDCKGKMPGVPGEKGCGEGSRLVASVQLKGSSSSLARFVSGWEDERSPMSREVGREGARGSVAAGCTGMNRGAGGWTDGRKR